MSLRRPWSLRRSLLILLGLLCTGAAACAPAATVVPERALSRPDGRWQTQVLTAGEGSRILLGTPANPASASLSLPGQVAWLAWHPGGDLLMVTTTLQRYSFGANYLVQLHRWDGQSPPAVRTLTDTSLKPLTLANWETRLAALPAPTLGPQGDVLAFLRLHDPPAFAPYLKVILCHLDQPGELALGSQAMPGAPLSFRADGEVLSWPGPTGEPIRVQPWLGGQLPAEAVAPDPVAVDPGLLRLRQLLLQGLLGAEDYRLQWQKRRQP